MHSCRCRGSRSSIVVEIDVAAQSERCKKLRNIVDGAAVILEASCTHVRGCHSWCLAYVRGRCRGILHISEDASEYVRGRC